MTGSPPTDLADLYRLGEQIERDKSTSLQVLRERDHALGLSCDARDDTARLQFWLHSFTTAEEQLQPAAPAWLSEASAAFVARLAAAVTGFLGMTTFLLASGRGLVNVFVFLLLFVVVQLLFCLVSALVMLRSVRGNAPLILPLNPARLVLSRVFPDGRFLRECQSVVRLLVLRYGQEFGAVFTLGAVAAFFAVLALSDFTFVWGSTFEVSDRFVRGFTDVVALPWSTWLPGATVPAQVIAESRYHPALTDLTQANIGSMRGWWPFLIMAMLSYALVPRLILWLLSRVLYVRLMRHSFRTYPGSEGILARMKAPVVSTQAREPEEEGRTEDVPVSLDDGLMLLNWAGALDAAADSSFREIRPVPPANILASGLGSLADDAQAGERIDRYRPERLLVAVKSWEPPLADLQDFLGGLQRVRCCTLCLVPLPGRAVTERHLQEWDHYARELSFDRVDVQALKSS